MPDNLVYNQENDEVWIGYTGRGLDFFKLEELIDVQKGHLIDNAHYFAAAGRIIDLDNARGPIEQIEFAFTNKLAGVSGA